MGTTSRDRQAEAEQFYELVGHGPGGAHFSGPDCGWWWCPWPQQTFDRDPVGQLWPDLRAATELLLKRGRKLITGSLGGIDLQTGSVATVHDWATLWLTQADHLETLLRAIEGADVPHESDAGILKREFVGKMQPLLREARTAQGRAATRGRRVDVPLERALARGAEIEWKYDEVAAILLFFGLERSNFEALKDRCRQADARRLKRAPTKLAENDELNLST